MKEKNNNESHDMKDLKIQTDFSFDDDLYNIKESLKQQVNDQIEDEQNTSREDDGFNTNNMQNLDDYPKKKKKRTGLKIFIGILTFIILFASFLIFTKPGNRLITKLLANYISSSVNKDDPTTPDVNEQEEVSEYDWNTREIVGRKEDYVTNILLVGIEEIFGGRNTDTMIIASINTRDNTVQLSSLMRDSYVSVPGWKSTKLNAAYAHGGIELLRDTIESNYKIHLDGFVSVNFDSFEKIIDLLGGVEIQLGAKEANYLNTTNYISNKAYRNVKEGINLLNGNQALGYCRVRKVPTYDGVNNDFGTYFTSETFIECNF